MGVVVRRYIDNLTIINFPYSTCISSFFGSSSLLMFLYIYIYVTRFCNYLQNMLYIYTILDIIDD